MTFDPRAGRFVHYLPRSNPKPSRAPIEVTGALVAARLRDLTYRSGRLPSSRGRMLPRGSAYPRGSPLRAAVRGCACGA